MKKAHSDLIRVRFSSCSTLSINRYINLRHTTAGGKDSIVFRHLLLTAVRRVTNSSAEVG